MKRRHCLYCGRRLPWKRAQNQFMTRAEADNFIATLPPEIRRYARLSDQTRQLELNPNLPRYEHGVFFVSFFAAEGGYGDNRFCGLNHGYAWAVAHTTEARPQ